MSIVSHTEVSALLQRFLDWAHTMGWRYTMLPYNLAHFRHFLEQRGVGSLAEVDAGLLLAYRRALAATRSPATVNGRLSALRALWRYLEREGLVANDIARDLASLCPDYFVPHLYGQAELSHIDAAARAAIGQTRKPAERFSRQMRRAAFALLRDCGLRVSEACRLNVDDYDSVARTLRIERTKFFKTRVIPLPRTTCALLEQYLEHRRWVVAQRRAPVELFFPSVRGRRLTRGSLEAPFKHLLRELNLYRPRRREDRTVFGSTNLHALRHSYAVRSLERWQQQRRDVERLLPLLSSYMGHAHVNYTKHYLHLSPLLSQLASERFGAMFLPLLDGYGTHDDE